MSLASVAAQQSALTAAANAAASGITASANAATSSTAAASTGAATNSLSSLSGNFSEFLQLLMTQLQNQDPSSPLDTSTFTTQLVQFASVEQQINTNTSLTQLIQLTQGGELLQSSAMVGKQIAVTSTQIPLQNSTGEVKFNVTTAGPVAIAIYNSAGQQIEDATVQATVGSNTWTWNGQTGSGSTAPDGNYNIAVEGTDGNGNATTVPFTVVGTATGVQVNGNALTVQMGSQSVNFSAIQSVLD